MQSTNTNRGDVQIESVAVPYVDLRGEPDQAVETTLRQILAETNSGSDTGRLGGLRALVIIEPQSSDSLASALCSPGRSGDRRAERRTARAAARPIP